MKERKSLPLFKFTPWMKTSIWGGSRLASFKGLNKAYKRLGESWELSAMPGKESIVSEGPDKGKTLSDLISTYGAELVGEKVAAKAPEEFPLLIKFIDADSNLSLQVHPDDDLAAERHDCSGKTEMWYLLETRPDAVIYAGFKHRMTLEEFDRSISRDSILDEVEAHRATPESIYFLPAGTIHAIGGGNMLIEIQCASDITYRIFDYNRLDDSGCKRELHIDQARDALRFDVDLTDIVFPPVQLTPYMQKLVDCEYFSVKRIDVDSEVTIDTSEIDSFVSVTCIAGDVSITVDSHKSVNLRCGETALIPASANTVRLSGKGSLVSATMPH